MTDDMADDDGSIDQSASAVTVVNAINCWEIFCDFDERHCGPVGGIGNSIVAVSNRAFLGDWIWLLGLIWMVDSAVGQTQVDKENSFRSFDWTEICWNFGFILFQVKVGIFNVAAIDSGQQIDLVVYCMNCHGPLRSDLDTCVEEKA